MHKEQRDMEWSSNILCACDSIVAEPHYYSNGSKVIVTNVRKTIYRQLPKIDTTVVLGTLHGIVVC